MLFSEAKSLQEIQKLCDINNTKYDYLTTKYLYYYLKFNQLNIQKWQNIPLIWVILILAN